ncbi:MAG: CotH kinase family protein [Bacteroidetes bacterium]|nr:CotH kinase family protein [Bacteroidota bacterium]
MIKKITNIFALVILCFGYQSKAQLTSTNLPIVMISYSGTISTTQIQGTMSIIDNLSGINTPSDIPKFSGMIGISLRGNASYPKSSYSIETWSTPNVSLDTSLLNMPSENDWVLLSSYEDRSLVRNVLAFNLHDKMGRYASRQKYCEVLVNNQYMGIYTFGEKIKRDSLRVDIANLTNLDNSGINLTGGYIVKIDGGGTGWTSAFAPPFATTQQVKFEYYYPDAGDITPTQQAYIKSYVDSFEIAMNAANFQDTTIGWRKFGAVNSFADFMIMQEMSRNNEAYRRNTYLYKDKGTKLRPGPLWSFELAFKNTADCNSSVDTGWCHNLGGICGTETKLAPFWWNKLHADTSFMDEVKCRYTDYRKTGNILDTTKIFITLDSVYTYLNANGALNRNFTKWPIWGVPLVNEPTPMATNYTQELSNLKNYIKTRLNWLDNQWLSSSTKCFPLRVDNYDVSSLIQVFPNPSTDKVNIQFLSSKIGTHRITLQSMDGRVLHQTNTILLNNVLDISQFPKGIYILTISSEKGKTSKKLIKE